MKTLPHQMKRDIQLVVRLLERGPMAPGSELAKALDRLRYASALRPSEKRRTAKRERTKSKTNAKAKRNAETAAIREAVFARAGGRCELCMRAEPTDLHHALGRKKVAQAPGNCLALCRACHGDITENRTPPYEHLRAQAAVFWAHGHHGTSDALERDAEWWRAKAQAADPGPICEHCNEPKCPSDHPGHPHRMDTRSVHVCVRRKAPAIREAEAGREVGR